MRETYRANLESYLASMLQAKKMLSAGILAPEDYAKIDTIIAKKYGISSCSLYCGIDLQTVRKLKRAWYKGTRYGIIFASRNRKEHNWRA